MILLIDNYDSFSYNLYQLLGSVYPDIEVIRNDVCTAEALAEKRPAGIVLSPGPGRPADAGICIETVRRYAGQIPILGVCLGHQAICEAFGGRVSYAARLMHGKVSEITLDTDSRLFHGMAKTIPVARYHSLSAVRDSLPPTLRVTAEAPDGEIMAVEHTTFPVFGVQFHPESVMTPDGKPIIERFLSFVQ